MQCLYIHGTRLECIEGNAHVVLWLIKYQLTESTNRIGTWSCYSLSIWHEVCNVCNVCKAGATMCLYPVPMTLPRFLRRLGAEVEAWEVGRWDLVTKDVQKLKSYPRY